MTFDYDYDYDDYAYDLMVIMVIIEPNFRQQIWHLPMGNSLSVVMVNT